MTPEEIRSSMGNLEPHVTANCHVPFFIDPLNANPDILKEYSRCVENIVEYTGGRQGPGKEYFLRASSSGWDIHTTLYELAEDPNFKDARPIVLHGHVSLARSSDDLKHAFCIAYEGLPEEEDLSLDIFDEILQTGRHQAALDILLENHILFTGDDAKRRWKELRSLAIYHYADELDQLDSNRDPEALKKEMEDNNWQKHYRGRIWPNPVYYPRYAQNVVFLLGEKLSRVDPKYVKKIIPVYNRILELAFRDYKFVNLFDDLYSAAAYLRDHFSTFRSYEVDTLQAFISNTPKLADKLLHGE